ncbi:MAG: type II secretion system F family protein [Candidatus Aenigmatarchaeota archaeon]
MVKLTSLQISLISIGIAIFLIIISIIINPSELLGNMIILSTFIILVPFFLRRYKSYKELKEMEEKFPVFLRDLIESVRAGMPLHQAIISASKIRYGVLSNEVKKMSNQISWGITLDKVLDQFAERVKSSRRMYSAIKIIRESYLGGGDIVSALDSVVDSQIVLIDAEKEKSSMLNQYVILMYAISILFIVIIVALNKIMIPIFNLGEEESANLGFTNPCALGNCMGLECNMCDLYQGVATHALFVSEKSNIGSYYTGLFFFMCLVQAISSGFVIGEIAENKALAGIKHSLILAAIVFGTFTILIKVGLIGV